MIVNDLQESVHIGETRFVASNATISAAQLKRHRAQRGLISARIGEIGV